MNKQHAIVIGHVLFTIITCIICIPAVLFWWLESGSALLADKLARKRYGIKEEGLDYFKMLSHEMPRSLFQIQDPVLASHQKFSEVQEERPRDYGDDEQTELDNIALRRHEADAETALDGSGDDLPESEEVEHPDRSVRD